MLLGGKWDKRGREGTKGVASRGDASQVLTRWLLHPDIPYPFRPPFFAEYYHVASRPTTLRPSFAWAVQIFAEGKEKRGGLGGRRGGRGEDRRGSKEEEEERTLVLASE